MISQKLLMFKGSITMHIISIVFKFNSKDIGFLDHFCNFKIRVFFSFSKISMIDLFEGVPHKLFISNH